MIDIHCHVFNARSLPLVGVLRSKGVWPSLASLLADAVLRIAGNDTSLELGRHRVVLGN